MGWREQQVAIMVDTMSGAMGITQATAEMLLSFASSAAGESSMADFIYLLQKLGHELITAQSGMASLVMLFNRVFSVVDSDNSPVENAAVLTATIQAFLVEQKTNAEQVCRNASALIPSDAVLLTHSASSTVFNTLLCANKAGKAPRVIAMEARPLYEGRGLAERLAGAGLDTTLIVDSAVYANLSSVELVLVGCDSLTTSGIISKIGTAGLAVCAQSLGIPCYFLADTTKIWPLTLGEQPVHERPQTQVWKDAPEDAHLTVQNHFYDRTPWTAVSGVITEKGMMTATEIGQLSQALTVHPLLHNVIAEVRSTI